MRPVILIFKHSNVNYKHAHNGDENVANVEELFFIIN